MKAKVKRIEAGKYSVETDVNDYTLSCVKSNPAKSRWVLESFSTEDVFPQKKDAIAYAESKGADVVSDKPPAKPWDEYELKAFDFSDPENFWPDYVS